MNAMLQSGKEFQKAAFNPSSVRDCLGEDFAGALIVPLLAASLRFSDLSVYTYNAEPLRQVIELDCTGKLFCQLGQARLRYESFEIKSSEEG